MYLLRNQGKNLSNTPGDNSKRTGSVRSSCSLRLQDRMTLGNLIHFLNCKMEIYKITTWWSWCKSRKTTHMSAD